MCRSWVVHLIVWSSLVVGGELRGEEASPSVPSGDKTVLENAFSEKLSGAALVGQFSIDGQDTGKSGQPERYELESVKKLRDDLWVFTAGIKYGETDVKLPITLKVLWAGDTPMISMTDLTIPGLGTFTARVMFYGDRYAGTWQHGDIGGHMWGRIERPKKKEQTSSGRESAETH